ncbi:MAG: UMP kinase [Candidatus Altiarchaeota archaeon]
MKVVISLGGSIMVPEEIDPSFIGDFAKLCRELCTKHQLAVVTGGGRTARKYITQAREFGASEIFCDLMGIEATRLNARLLAAAIGAKANLEPPTSYMGAVKALDFGKVVVMGGTDPGHSTDGVAAFLSEYIKADLLIKATAVDGVYDKDPKKHKDAKRFDKLSVKELINLVKSYSVGAGHYELIDLLAAKVIQRSNIKTVFVDGRDLKNMKNVFEGKKFTGTIITD